MLIPTGLVLLGLVAICLASDGSMIDGTGCPAVFDKRCRCGKQFYPYWNANRNDTYVVNCTDSGFTETKMLEMLPLETQVLLFNGNNINLLDWNLFGMWDDHKYLEVVDLTNNNISEILGKAFHKVAQVKRLVLNHNNLKISGEQHHRRILTNLFSLEELHLTDAFAGIVDSKWFLDDLKDVFLASNMTKLYKLHLEQNKIWTIGEDLFCSLPALTDIYLGDNQLVDVDFGFECVQNLRYLDLSYNKIKRLDAISLKKIDTYFGEKDGKYRKINLNQNPFVCDCYLRTFYDWLSRTKAVHDMTNLRCFNGLPDSNAGLKILDVKVLDCPDLPKADPSSSAGSAFTHALLIILILVAITATTIILVVNREKVRTNMKPILDNFQRSMQYKTIEKDVAEFQAGQPPEVNV